MKKLYAAVAMFGLSLVAPSVFAIGSGDQSVTVCSFSDVSGNSCFWRCPDMDEQFRTEKVNGQCVETLYRCNIFPKKYLRAVMGTREFWETPDKMNYYFGSLPPNYDCTTSPGEVAAQKRFRELEAKNASVSHGTAQNDPNSFVDTRNGKRYRTVKIGSRVWMAENLNYRAIDSYCYGDDDRNCDTYGRLYTWEAANRVCPDGWSLPDSDDMNYQDFNLNNFSALNGGERYADDGKFYDMGDRAYFWLANARGDKGDAMVFKGGKMESLSYPSSKKSAFSVRCIQDWGASCKEKLGKVSDKDGNEYRTLKIGKREWMAENLLVERHAEVVEKKVDFVCPDGWHVPEKEEFEVFFMVASTSDIHSNDRRLRQTHGTKENPCSMNMDYKHGYWTSTMNGNSRVYVDWMYKANEEKADPIYKEGNSYPNMIRCVKNDGFHDPVKKPAKKVSQVLQPVGKKVVQKKFVLKEVKFRPGQYRIESGAVNQLKKAAEYLASKYADMMIEVVGHTDNLDRPEKSKQLSQKRADEVKSYLAMAGIPSEFLLATGKGGVEPVASNNTPDGREQNNRIEIVVFTYQPEETPKETFESSPQEPVKPAVNNAELKSEPRPCKEKELAYKKLGECYDYTEGSKEHRRCMAAYQNLLKSVQTKCGKR